jgi:hypothetical protein
MMPGMTHALGFAAVIAGVLQYCFYVMCFSSTTRSSANRWLEKQKEMKRKSN